MSLNSLDMMRTSYGQLPFFFLNKMKNLWVEKYHLTSLFHSTKEQ